MRHKSQRRIEHGGVDACKVCERVVERKDLGWADQGDVPWVDNILDGLCTRKNLELSSPRIEHQDHPNIGESETRRHGGK